jgi:hypothetical protein
VASILSFWDKNVLICSAFRKTTSAKPHESPGLKGKNSPNSVFRFVFHLHQRAALYGADWDTERATWARGRHGSRFPLIAWQRRAGARYQRCDSGTVRASSHEYTNWRYRDGGRGWSLSATALPAARHSQPGQTNRGVFDGSDYTSSDAPWIRITIQTKPYILEPTHHKKFQRSHVLCYWWKRTY